MFRKFNSIEHFRHIVKQVKDTICFIGRDEEDNPIFDYSRELPKIEFIGSTKLHGTNACCGYKNGEIFIQSRNRIITPENDNAGFAQWVEERKDEWLKFFKSLEDNGFIYENSTIYVYGEFAGDKIQKGVGISNIERSFFIFNIVSVKNDNECNITIEYPEFTEKIKLPSNTYNIFNFKTYKIKIDFNNPEEAQNEILKLVDEVEKDCPVARKLLPDFEGELIGEGIVWKSECGKYTFKSKGEKHSMPKVKSFKKLPSEEKEKLKTVDKCVEEIFSVQRCNQALTEIFGIDFEKNLDMKKIGDYIKWVLEDTKKEEYDIIEKYGLKFKDVSKKLSNKIKKYFIEILKNY